MALPTTALNSVQHDDEDTKIYADYNATTPMAPEVKEAVIHAMNIWGNPSSDTVKGRRAKHAIDVARRDVAEMIGSKSPSDIIFTSGGTEANNLVIWSALEHHRKSCLLHPNTGVDVKGRSEPPLPHVVTTVIEHDSVLLPLKRLRDTNQIELTICGVKNGRVSTETILTAIRFDTCLVSVMMANNETGIIQPIKQIFSAVRKKHSENPNAYLCNPIILHTDSAQAIGKIPVDVRDLPVDALTIVGHKFYGPRIGALFVRNLTSKCWLYTHIVGGGQEGGFRSGTENTPMIVGLGKACSLVTQHLKKYTSNFSNLMRVMEESLRKSFKDKIYFNATFSDNNFQPAISTTITSNSGVCACDKRDYSCPPTSKLDVLPNTLSISFTGGDAFSGKAMLQSCKRLLASCGAACHSESGEVSSVLIASGIPPERAKNTIRLSLGRETTAKDVKAIVEDLEEAYWLQVKP